MFVRVEFKEKAIAGYVADQNVGLMKDIREAYNPNLEISGYTHFEQDCELLAYQASYASYPKEVPYSVEVAAQPEFSRKPPFIDLKKGETVQEDRTTKRPVTIELNHKSIITVPISKEVLGNYHPMATDDFVKIEIDVPKRALEILRAAVDASGSLSAYSGKMVDLRPDAQSIISDTFNELRRKKHVGAVDFLSALDRNGVFIDPLAGPLDPSI